MDRRCFVQSSLAASMALCIPSLSSAQARAKVLRFVPQADLASVDPIISSPTVTRNHAYLVYDTLFGLDANYAPQPQMLEGFSVEQDGLVWRLMLREGLWFHDGQPVLARDVTASIRRWAVRDLFGATLMRMTAELTAPSDREIRFRLLQSFPALPDALGKIQPPVLAIMPERLASTDPSRPVTEVIGSGPFRFLPGEQVTGSRVAYARFEGYVPRADGPLGISSGPKRALVDRVEWIVMPEPSTASAALQSGEVDWWEQPYPDLLPVLRSDPKLVVSLKEQGGSIPVLRFNCIQPPFNNPAIRRAVEHAIDRSDVMRTIAGDDRSMWNDDIGIFTSGTPMATDVGVGQFQGPRDLRAARRALQDAGYNGEKVVTLASTDIPANSLSSEVVADVLKQIGMNVDMQVMDYGTLVQRRTNRQPVANGGWSAFITRFDGATLLNPAVALITRGNGANAWFGWPESSRLESLYESWLRAEALPQKQAICRDIQFQMWEDATAFPLGQILLPTAYSKNLRGVLEGFPKFYNVEKS